MQRHWAEVNGIRNVLVDKRDVLSHVSDLIDDRTGAVRIRLDNAIAQTRLRKPIEETLAGAAQFVCQQAAQELGDSDPQPLPRHTWPQMRAELGLYS